MGNDTPLKTDPTGILPQGMSTITFYINMNVCLHIRTFDCGKITDLFVFLCCRVFGAMANASPDLDNAEVQRQLNNNNRPIGSGFWETECTSSKLFECSRIKALAGQRFIPYDSMLALAKATKDNVWLNIGYYVSF